VHHITVKNRNNKCPNQFGKRLHRRLVTLLGDPSSVGSAPHIIRGLLDGHESAPIRHLDSPVFPTHRQTDTQTTLRATSVAIGRIYALRAGDAA